MPITLLIALWWMILLLATETIKIPRKIFYADQIPLVSGYFSFADTIHSLVPLLEKLFKESEITAESIFRVTISNTVPALQLVDMIVLYFLTDMELSQQEEGKNNKDTGKKKADLIATL